MGGRLGWLMLGASVEEAGLLARARLVPAWGGQDFEFELGGGSPIDTITTALDGIDMSNVLVGGAPFDTALADSVTNTQDFIATGGTLQVDSNGNILNDAGQMLMTHDELVQLDPTLAAEVVAANGTLGGSSATGDQLFMDPGTGNVVDAQGNVVATAQQLDENGIHPSELTGVPSSTGTGQPAYMTQEQFTRLTELGLTPTPEQIAGSTPLSDAQIQALRDQGLTTDQLTQPGAASTGNLGQLGALLAAAGLPQSLAAVLARALPILGAGGLGALVQNMVASSAKASYTPALAGPTPGQASANRALSSQAGASNLEGAITGSVTGQNAAVTGANTLARNFVGQTPSLAAIQNASIGGIAANMPGEVPPDPTTTATQQLVLSALRGQDDPQLAREFQDQIETMRNLGAIRGGPGASASYFASSPGIEAATRLGESQNIQRDQAYLNRIKALEPLYTQRVTSDQSLADQQLRERTSLSTIGNTTPASIAGLFNQIAPTSSVANYGSNLDVLNAQMQNQARSLGTQTQQNRANVLGTNLGSTITDAIMRGVAGVA